MIQLKKHITVSFPLLLCVIMLWSLCFRFQNNYSKINNSIEIEEALIDLKMDKEIVNLFHLFDFFNKKNVDLSFYRELLSVKQSDLIKSQCDLDIHILPPEIS